MKRDEKSQEKAPQVIQNSIKSSSPKGSRSYSTSVRRQQEAMIRFEDTGIETQGHKFGLPELPLQSNLNIKHRYDPVIHQVTNLIMQDGKLSVAQRVCSSVSRLISHSPYSIS